MRSPKDSVPRRGRGKSKASIRLIDACHEILSEIQPASVRAVCYRLFTMDLIPSMSKGSTNRVSTQLVYARENDIIPWEWIVDETREAERVQAWADPEEIISATVHGYRRDYWQDQPESLEVWSEKGTIRGTLAPVLDQYGVTFRVMHGYGSATAIQSIAKESSESPKLLTAFYVGDFDPSGLHMSEVDLPTRLERYGGCVHLQRIALTAADVNDDSLPHFSASTKTGDPRHHWFTSRYGPLCWELDAMSPVDLRKRVERAIVGLLDLDAWNHAKDVEASQVDSMRQFHAQWRASISGQASK
jgi:hypothetical protein